MSLLGIDYGEKRVGIAYSDETEQFAFPYAVFENTQGLLEKILALYQEKKARGIVLGLSKNYKQEENPIMKKIKQCAAQLQEHRVPVFYESEILSTQEAAHIQGEHKNIDASAAAIILQSYLDRNKSISKTNS